MITPGGVESLAAIKLFADGEIVFQLKRSTARAVVEVRPLSNSGDRPVPTLGVSRALLEQMMNAVTEHVCVLDSTGEILAANSAWKEFGAANNAQPSLIAEGVNYVAVCERAAHRGDKDAADFASSLRDLLGLAGPDSFELQYPCHSPTAQRWFSVHAQRVVGDGPIRAVVEHRDITDATLSQSARLESEEHYRMLFQTSIDGVLHTRPDGSVLAANPAACALLQMSSEEICRRGRRGLIDPRDHRLQVGLQNRAQKSGAARGRLTMVRGDGSKIEVDVQSSLYSDSKGRPHAFVVLHDRSAQTLAEQARWDAERRLRDAQKLESIGTLAGGIAHDFNNILAAILGCASLMECEVPAAGASREAFETLQRAAHRGRDIVQQILSFSRRQPQQPKSIQSASRLLLAVASLLRSTVPAGIHITVDPGPDALHVLVNEGQMHQVLLNLGVNAWQAIRRQNGQIKLSMQVYTVEDLATGVPVNLRPGEYVRLDVADDGEGMSEDVRVRIFEPIFTTKPVRTGTGLGLSVAHGIVLEHRGEISDESQPGKGTTFHVWLPLALESTSAGAEESGFDALGKVEGNEKIAVVDDDEFMRFVLERILRSKGYLVTCFASPHAAFDAIRNDPEGFDLVLTDYNMPDGSGADLVQELAKLRPGLPVVVSSGYVDDEVQRRAIAAGAVRVLAKERMEQLGAELRDILDACSGQH